MANGSPCWDVASAWRPCRAPSGCQRASSGRGVWFIRNNQWNNPPHRSHLCHSCGHIWRPADVPTNGVAAIKTKGSADSAIVQPRDKETERTEQAVNIAVANAMGLPE